MKPSFVFFGTSDFSVIILDELKKEGFLPQLIVAAPDRRQGRGMKLVPPPTKLWAEKNNIEVLQPEKLRKENFSQTLKEKAPKAGWDVFILASYGKIISQDIIDLPKHGTLNVHPSLLPLHRGPSPLEAQILSDNPTVGVTIMLTDEKMDHGPLFAQTEITFDESDWPPYRDELEDILAHEGGALLAHTLPRWIQGEIEAITQEHEKATYCSMIEKKNGLIDIEHGNTRENFLKIRAYASWPRAYYFTKRNGRDIRVVVTRASWENDALIIERVIPEGKKEIRYKDYCTKN